MAAWRLRRTQRSLGRHRCASLPGAPAAAGPSPRSRGGTGAPQAPVHQPSPAAPARHPAPPRRPCSRQRGTAVGWTGLLPDFASRHNPQGPPRGEKHQETCACRSHGGWAPRGRPGPGDRAASTLSESGRGHAVTTCRTGSGGHGVAEALGARARCLAEEGGKNVRGPNNRDKTPAVRQVRQPLVPCPGKGPGLRRRGWGGTRGAGPDHRAATEGGLSRPLGQGCGPGACVGPRHPGRRPFPGDSGVRAAGAACASGCIRPCGGPTATPPLPAPA